MDIPCRAGMYQTFSWIHRFAAWYPIFMATVLSESPWKTRGTCYRSALWIWSFRSYMDSDCTHSWKKISSKIRVWVLVWTLNLLWWFLFFTRLLSIFTSPWFLYPIFPISRTWHGKTISDIYHEAQVHDSARSMLWTDRLGSSKLLQELLVVRSFLFLLFCAQLSTLSNIFRMEFGYWILDEWCIPKEMGRRAEIYVWKGCL